MSWQWRLVGPAIAVVLLLSLGQPGLALPRQALSAASAPASATAISDDTAPALHTATPSRHGPQRTTYEDGIPRHAYSPFDQAEGPACPPGGCDSQPGVVLVKLAPEVAIAVSGREAVVVNAGSLNTLMQRHGVTRVEPVFPGARPPAGGVVLDGIEPAQPVPDLTRWVKVYLRGDKTATAAAVDAFGADPNVQVAEPDYLRKPVGQAPGAQEGEKPASPSIGVEAGATLQLPGPATDPLYSQQWHLDAANIPAAWQWLETNGYAPGGSPDIVVAVIDTGVDYTHPDLASNMWVNPPEFGGNPGVDDDGNGYVDDVYGADMVTPDGDPQDDHGHGTHVAGIIAAQANNGEGGVGVAYNTQIMALKAAQYSGVLASSDIAEAVYYAVEKGADVINMSFGGYARSQVEEDALAVAFGTAVLVAAAGNDGYPNEGPCIPARPMYPAAQNWVLGVMASASGGGKASFSNYDCLPHTSREYELMAPGVDVWSTLPVANYAAWDGTSMAAPIVSGIAALVRTAFANKDLYSSRFIMGQIAANAVGGTGGLADAHSSLTIAPEPELSYLEHWLFDTENQSASNDDDGIVDAGETIDLAIIIRNHWGKADPVTVTLEAWAEGAVFPDPYVEMITDTVSYSAIGSFNTDDNGLIYDNDVIVGVENPFRFTVPITTPNDHVIPFLLTMTSGNGYDSGDPNAPYVFEDRFYLIVQRGVELPRIIDQNMTLTDDYYWLLPDATLIEQGAAVTVTEGTQIQFWSGDPADPYHGDPEPYIQVEGSLHIQGTVDEPVELFPWPLFTDLPARFLEAGNGHIEAHYFRMINPVIATDPSWDVAASWIDHAYFVEDGWALPYPGPNVNGRLVSNSIFHSLGGQEYNWYIYGGTGRHVHLGNLFDSCFMHIQYMSQCQGSVFLKNYRLQESQQGIRDYFTSLIQFSGYKAYRPAFLRFVFPVSTNDKTYFAVSKPDSSYADGYLDVLDAFANQLGGHIVTINDSTENTLVTDYRNQTLTQSNFQQAYSDMDCGSIACWELFNSNLTIGLTDQASEGTFEWLNGEPVTYTNWASGQPDNGSCSTCDEDFVYLDSSGFWRDTSSVTSYPALLEVPGTITQAELDDARDAFIEGENFPTTFRNNAILNVWWDPNTDHWMPFQSVTTRDYSYYITHNYWGTTSTTLIETAIEDYYDDFNWALHPYQPILVEPPEEAYPFVTDVILSTSVETETVEVGAEVVTFTVKFNRPMSTTVEPAVSFGPDMPMTDYTIHPVDGGWQDPYTWVGRFTVTPVTGDGYQLIRVAGAVAADDPWLVTGDDSERFRFEIITSGSSAMNLQANGGEGYVDLMWTQDDFDLLSGFNLYRATTQDGTYSRINQGIIPPDARTYRDTEVQPGEPYYYKFTIVKSDMTESGDSNVATATPIDTIPPAISHTPLTEAPFGLPLTLYADVTDNVGVQNVLLYYRPIGATPYTTKTMVHTTGDRYSATIAGSEVTAPGLEYYIEADDGVTTVQEGTASLPYQVLVEDRPVVTIVNPDHGPTDGGTPVTISGSNFKPGASVTFGGAVAGDVTVLAPNQITCTTPPHFPETVDVTVTNPDMESGTLLRAYTFQSPAAQLSLPDTGGEQMATVQVPVNAANVQGLAAASLTVTFDPAVLTAQGATTGSLTPGWSVAANAGTPGEVRLSMASTGGTVSGSGVLAYIEFDIAGSPGVTSTLQFSDVLLNDGAIPSEITAGSFAVQEVYDIAGMVQFWNGGAGVPGVDLRLDGDRVYTDLSQSDGSYAVSGAAAGDYTLFPSKSDDANGISAYDASFALQHDAGLTTLAGHQALAADVNKSGAITSMDAFYILQKAVDLVPLPFPGAGVVWDFDPASRSYTNLSGDLTGQDFTGILLGDVSGNWTAGGGTHSGLLAPTGQLDVGAVQAFPSSTVTVPVEIALTGADLYGVDLSIVYSRSVLSPLDASQGDLAGGWMVADNWATPGELRVSLAGAEPITGDGKLLLLAFEVVATEPVTTPLTVSSASLNEGQIPVTIDSGQVAVGAGPVVSIARVGADAVLSWDRVFGASSYQVYRGTAPYFTPGVDSALAVISGTVFTDTAAIGDPDTNHYYVLTALDPLDQESRPSNRVGAFDFTLRETTGTDYTWVVLPLDNAALGMASQLEQHVEGNCSAPISVLSIARWNATGQQLVQYTTVPIPIGDFALETGQAYRIEADVDGADACVWTLTGAVPPRASLSFDLVTTTGTDYTWISLPLDQDGIVLASDLEAAIEAASGADVLSVCRWNAVGQQYVCYTTVPIPIGDFGLAVGYPYRVETSAPTTWP